MNKSLAQLLEITAALHHHICPRQILGVRMGMLAGEWLSLDLPQSDKRLLTIVETDGCFCDGISAATNCWVGRRTLRIEDYGKVAATFVDTVSGRAVRMIPNPAARHSARRYAPEATNNWEAMRYGYERMPAEELLLVGSVELTTPAETIISQPGLRALCENCGEEIMNEREVWVHGRLVCRSCAAGAYYEYTAGASPYLLASDREMDTGTEGTSSAEGTSDAL